MAVASILEKYGYDFMMTSAAEGKHKVGSLHPKGRAFDFRTTKIVEGHRDSIFTAIRESLGPEFDVLYEAGTEPHGHVEWDPDYLKGK